MDLNWRHFGREVLAVQLVLPKANHISLLKSYGKMQFASRFGNASTKVRHNIDYLLKNQ
ncbi:MAG: hypothetical protein H6695_14570 [Deferribacteres bacterium]|nr:hypothetical protein [Deferribacteres bacterium]